MAIQHVEKAVTIVEAHPRLHAMSAASATVLDMPNPPLDEKSWRCDITNNNSSPLQQSPEDGRGTDQGDNDSNGNLERNDNNNQQDDYDRFSRGRKIVIVSVMSWCGLLSPISSTAVLSAIPDVAADFSTTGTVINLSNALYLVFMALSPFFWGSLGRAFGRRPASLATGLGFLVVSAATAASPELASYFVFRMLSAFTGTAFLVLGTAVIGDLYAPLERATALAAFYSGTLVGPTIGPLVGGVIVTYTSWRVIFWLQTGLAALGVVGVYLAVPETIVIPPMSSPSSCGSPLFLPSSKAWKTGSPWQKMRLVCRSLNPWPAIRLLAHPNVLVIALVSGTVVWNQYSLLTPIRYVLNPRFHLESPLVSGLFYLAPGSGYMVGTLFGGRWADRTARKWVARRQGIRVPEDRLRSCVSFLLVPFPACVLLYGWSVDREFGGIALPVVVMFLQGVAQLFCFPSLNTYCLDVDPASSAEMIAANYAVRYVVGAVGSATVLPIIQAVGVGWFSTISALMLAISGGATYAVVRYGPGWRRKRGVGI